MADAALGFVSMVRGEKLATVEAAVASTTQLMS